MENVIEFINDQERATVTFSQRRYKSKIKKLAEKYPEECRIIAENKDGSICAHIPTKWVKVSPPRKISDEQKEAARKRMLDYHENM